MLALGTTIFYLTALVSFQPLDPTPFSAAFPPRETLNVAGRIGAFLASLSYHLFGAVSYLLPLPLLSMSVLSFLNKPQPFGRSRLFGWMIFVASALCFIASYFPQIVTAGFPLASGGVLGLFLSKSLHTYLGSMGVVILLLTSSFCSAVLVTHMSFFRPLKFLRDLSVVKLWLPLLEWLSNIRMPWRRGKPSLVQAPEASRPLIAIEQPAPEFTGAMAANEMDDDEEEDAKSSLKERLRSLRMKKEAELFTAPKEEEKPENASAYAPPPSSLFKTSEAMGQLDKTQIAEYEATADQLVKAFEDFSIKGSVVGIQPGPVVTVFEFEPAAGIKLAKIVALIDDIALSLKVDSIFIHPVSGKRAIGIQVPNKRRETVYLGDIIHSDAFTQMASPLTFAMGKSLKGEPVCADLTTMPHLLMAGQTGAGKSVAINSLLCSVIMKASPEDVRMILVDPKILELKIYEGIPHLLMPVITEPARAAQALRWASVEMDRRYRLMETARVRHITGFNAFWDKATPEEKNLVRASMDGEVTGRIPFILIVIDELADLMLTAPKEVENDIQRLAQKARACGIHLVLATQRPSVDVITGVIKANLPCRIAFKVFSRADSRTILDAMGADKLLGKGDMLYLKPGTSKLERIQGAFLADEEVVSLVEALRDSSKSAYDEQAISWIENEMERQAGGDKEVSGAEFDEDPKWDEAIGIGQRHGIISASFLQRHLKIGYNRAARIVEAMESQGLVEKASGSKPRKWLGSHSAEL